MTLAIAHIGILVADLESSRERWSRALGLPFSPITRYRPDNWSDLGNPEPHLHDARLTFFLGDNPSIEILEFVGNGTHSPAKGEGGHHLSFPPVRDNALRRRELAAIGVGTDGEIWHDGRWIFTFTDARALNNVYTEWVEEHPDHPDVKDDGSPVNRLPDGSKTLFDVRTILDLGGHRPASGIVEIGVQVDDLGQACGNWSAVTGSEFAEARAASPGWTSPGGSPSERSAVSRDLAPRVRLVQPERAPERQGLSYAVVEVGDVERTARRLRADGVPIADAIPDARGHLRSVDVAPGFLNGFALRFERSAGA